ncbi:MAG: hypothetical protein IT578_05045 [Verrucomicrobiae bacterium]|nr:hypothetical protein [Verrucomicrobiae bacterium]
MNLHKLFPVGLACASLLLGAGCASTDSATEFTYADPQGPSLRVVIPKELDVQDLKVEIRAREGVAKIAAKKWKSRSVEVIKAAGAREAARGKAAAALANKLSSGLTEGAMKGVVP